MSYPNEKHTLDNEEPDWETWISFFLHSMQKQKDRLQQKIDTAKLLDGDVPALGIRILELLREQGSVQISTLEQATKESRSTLKLRINELVARGKIQRHGRGRSTWCALANSSSTW